MFHLYNTAQRRNGATAQRRNGALGHNYAQNRTSICQSPAAKLRGFFCACLLLFACDNLNSDTAVGLPLYYDLNVRGHLYPSGFSSEFANNLNFFRDGVGVDFQTKVPYDHIFVANDKLTSQARYVNTTSIGLYLSVLVEVEKAGNEFALARIGEVLGVLETIRTRNGLYFWPYEMTENKLVPSLHGDGPRIPAEDNANLAWALAGVAGAYWNQQGAKKAIADRAEALLQRQIPGWLELYDSGENQDGISGAIKGELGADPNINAGRHIDRKANEGRLATLWAALITRGQAGAVPTRSFNTIPWAAKNYTFNGQNYETILPFDGGVFQAMLPAIWLNEPEWITPNYDRFKDMLTIGMLYAAKHNIPMLSASSTIYNNYTEFGSPLVSEKIVATPRNINKIGTGTPHAVALAYMVYPDAAIAALQALKAQTPKIETPFGWYDAVDKDGNMTAKILSLDQGMFVASFLAKEIRADVQRYLEAKNYMADVRTMYQNFYSGSRLNYAGISGTTNLDAELSGYDQQPLWKGVPIPVK